MSISDQVLAKGQEKAAYAPYILDTVSMVDISSYPPLFLVTGKQDLVRKDTMKYAQVRSVVLEGLTVRFDVSVSNTGTIPEPGSLPVLNFSGEEIRTQHFSYEESCVQIFFGQNGDLTAQ